MGKKKGKAKATKATKDEPTYKESNEHYDGLEFDAADAFEANEDNEIMTSLGKLKGRNKAKDVSGGIREMYALSGDDSSDDPDESDLTDWGRKKKFFYGGNPNEYNNKMSKKNVEDGDDIDEAEAEEAESKVLQLKQLEQMDESDFFDAFNIGEAKKVKESTKVDKKVRLDMSQLSKKERLALFNRQSPEFAGIMADFESKMDELVEKLQPVVDLADDEASAALNGPGMDYLRTKYHLILNYCVNILCYVMFKSKGANLKMHPLTGRIVQYKQMLDQMAPIDKVVMPQVETVLNAGPAELAKLALHKTDGEPEPSPKQTKMQKPKKRLKILDKKDEERAAADDLTTDERIALEVYGALKKGKRAEVSDSESDGDIVDGEQMSGDVKDGDVKDGEEEDGEERRAITYQMAKNKGLAPKRNKLQRNPRVKHRHKFEKAKVRRKGQVRPVRQEVKKYAGEVSGINIRVKKGIKLS